MMAPASKSGQRKTGGRRGGGGGWGREKIPGEEHRHQTGVGTGQSQGAPRLSNKALTTSPCPPPPALSLQTHRLPLRLGFFLAVRLLPDRTLPLKTPTGKGACGGSERRAGTRESLLADRCRFQSAGHCWPGRAAISLSHGHLNATRERCVAKRGSGGGAGRGERKEKRISYFHAPVTETGNERLPPSPGPSPRPCSALSDLFTFLLKEKRMPTWLWDAGVGAVVRGRTYGFGNRNRIPTNAECMADPGLVVHRMQTLLQKSENSKPWSRCCCQKKRCPWKLLQPSGTSPVIPILPWSEYSPPCVYLGKGLRTYSVRQIYNNQVFNLAEF
ncbi:uncharacterized protein GJ701_016311 isoform 2-T2 [Geothlypis trichas]